MIINFGTKDSPVYRDVQHIMKKQTNKEVVCRFKQHQKLTSPL